MALRTSHTGLPVRFTSTVIRPPRRVQGRARTPFRRQPPQKQVNGETNDQHIEDRADAGFLPKWNPQQHPDAHDDDDHSEGHARDDRYFLVQGIPGVNAKAQRTSRIEKGMVDSKILVPVSALDSGTEEPRKACCLRGDSTIERR
jgi:hypothetical protein